MNLGAWAVLKHLGHNSRKESIWVCRPAEVQGLTEIRKRWLIDEWRPVEAEPAFFNTENLGVSECSGERGLETMEG